MTINEVVALLNKAASVVGDAPVILKGIEAAAETEIKSIGLELSSDGTGGSTLTINHAPADPAPAPVEPAAPAEPAEAPPAGASQ